MKNLVKKFKLILIAILSLFFVTCDDDDVVLPEVIAQFTYTVNNTNGVVTFINTSENAQNYSWDFGDSTVSTEINPTKVYDTGTYNVVLTANNVSGASDTFEDTITILLPEDLAFPIDFDNDNVQYTASTFNGATFEVVQNPDESGANPNATNVGAITNSGAQFEGFYFDLALPLDLSAGNTVSVLFWSDTPVDILLKLEEGTGADVETTASHGGTGWEQLYFTFSSTDSFSRFTVFIDGPGTTAGTFYIDSISQLNDDEIPCAETMLFLPIDFDCNGIDYESKRVAGDIGFAIIDNPEISGANAVETKVGEITNIGNQWENLNFTLDTPIDFSVDKGIKLKLYSTVSVPIKLKVETGGTPVENDQTHGGSGWEELTFELPTSESFSNIIVFVDGPGNTAGTFYIDDYEQVAVQASCTETMLFLPIDFDCDGIDYESKRVAGDIGFAIIDNPEISGANAVETKVGEITNIGNQWENLNFTLDTPIDFSVDKGIKLKLYSTVSVPIKLKVETGGTPVENDQTHGGTGWEELTFELPTSESFSNIIVFVDGPGNTAGTFYIDDYEQVAVQASCTETMLFLPIDFDCDTIDYESKRVAGDIGFAIIDNPEISGANAVATKVGEITNIGNQWENLNFTLDTPIDFSVDKGIKLKLYSTVSVPIKLKVETGGTPVENDQTHGGSGWEELTFELPTSESFSNIIVFVDGPGNTAGTFYIDDYEQVPLSAGGGSLTTLPADFENGEVFSKTFEGGVIGSNAPNPSVSGINVSANVYKFEKPINTEWYGGMENDFDPLGLTSGQDVVIKIKMFGTKGNVPVQLQLNRNPTIGSQPNYSNVQTSGPANTWTEITFTITAPTFDDPALYDTIVIIPDWDNTNNPTSSTEIYYIDDIILE